MKDYFNRIGATPFVILGGLGLVIGLLAMNHIMVNFWPIDVSRLDLSRDTALDRAEATLLLQAIFAVMSETSKL
jgi:hypothetical protein